MKIVLAPLAAKDLREAHEFIARDNPAAADQVLVALSETVGLLASGRVQGRSVTLKSGDRLHTWSHPPYRIYYRIVGEELQVARVYHQARRPIE